MITLHYKPLIMKNFAYLFLFASCMLQAQVTLQVTSIPANTPEGDAIYVAGSFNNWNPGDAAFQLTENNGIWSITIPEGSGAAEYKFTRGSWDAVEGNEEGNFRPNRTFNFTGEAQTIYHTILSWEDLGGTSTSTAAWNVSVMANDFYMPQLDRNRKIWLYLPPDYETSTKNYPVIYMHDGQNLFDNLTAFAGEWQVDETLNSLFDQGDYGAIVIGIENGGNARINEYTPWENAEYGGGEGQAYMDFIAQTLKPYVDANYRTRPEADFTALIGSSLGGLISTYGGVSHSDVFEKIGAFSPSYWIVEEELNNYITNSTADLGDMRIYFVASANESATLAGEIETVKNLLQNQGLTADNTLVKIDSYGGHNEAYWSGEFAAAYQWLFAEENLSTSNVLPITRVKFYLNHNQLTVSGLQREEKAVLYNAKGQKVTVFSMQNGINRLNVHLGLGLYFLKGETTSAKLLVK